jgi:hypothetical protein
MNMQNVLVNLKTRISFTLITRLITQKLYNTQVKS